MFKFRAILSRRALQILCRCARAPGFPLGLRPLSFVLLRCAYGKKVHKKQSSVKEKNLPILLILARLLVYFMHHPSTKKGRYKLRKEMVDGSKGFLPIPLFSSRHCGKNYITHLKGKLQVLIVRTKVKVVFLLEKPSASRQTLRTLLNLQVRIYTVSISLLKDNLPCVAFQCFSLSFLPVIDSHALSKYL